MRSHIDTHLHTFVHICIPSQTGRGETRIVGWRERPRNYEEGDALQLSSLWRAHTHVRLRAFGVWWPRACRAWPRRAWPRARLARTWPR